MFFLRRKQRNTPRTTTSSMSVCVGIVPKCDVWRSMPHEPAQNPFSNTTYRRLRKMPRQTSYVPWVRYVHCDEGALVTAKVSHKVPEALGLVGAVPQRDVATR